MEQTLSQRMELFSQMISCGQNLSYWEMDPGLQLIRSTSTDAELFRAFLLTDPGCSGLLQYIRSADSQPLVLAGEMGLTWVVSPEILEHITCRVHLIGPVFTSAMSTQSLEQELQRRQLPRELVEHFLATIRQVPVVPLTILLGYGLMLHYCVTGEKREVSDYRYTRKEAQQSVEPDTSTISGGTWYAEQMAMKMVEEGRIDYKKAMTNLSNVSGTIARFDASSLRMCKNYLISSVTLVTRAAIRGGLDPQTAYHLGELYMTNIENATAIVDLVQLHGTMYEDFVQRVHKIRTSTDTSAAIRACCNYIELHLAEKITMQTLSSQAGYAEYYLAQKFKKETGMTVAQFIRQKRTERARLLLRTSNQSIADIGESLGFCNTSYFCSVFQDITGKTPKEYRDNI